MKSPNQIEQDFVVLRPDKTASIEPADSTLYERLDKTYGDFSGHELISCYEFDSDWTSWEIHPHGDEVVVLMSGEVSFILQMEEGETSIKLSEQGQYVIVPKGIWHTAKTAVKSKLLFITPGQATQHKMIK
ncbi:MAG: cupin [Cellvibrio sp.]|uniref:cupin domain-containing protein n=1 Tax=Cellvibrio sp. TaxID=1965322 RepID=UPI00319FCCA9